MVVAEPSTKSDHVGFSVQPRGFEYVAYRKVGLCHLRELFHGLCKTFSFVAMVDLTSFALRKNRHLDVEEMRSIEILSDNDLAIQVCQASLPWDCVEMTGSTKRSVLNGPTQVKSRQHKKELCQALPNINNARGSCGRQFVVLVKQRQGLARLPLRPVALAN